MAAPLMAPPLMASSVTGSGESFPGFYLTLKIALSRPITEFAGIDVNCTILYSGGISLKA
jgi:hypothetical protein